MVQSELDRQSAERLRAALVACAEAAHEDARVRGLCWEGAWEAAVAAMRALPLDAALPAHDAAAARGPGAPAVTR
jgi:hypothetical protein